MRSARIGILPATPATCAASVISARRRGSPVGPASHTLVAASTSFFGAAIAPVPSARSEEHTSELQSRRDLVCRLLLEKKKKSHTHTAQLSSRGTAAHLRT